MPCPPEHRPPRLEPRPDRLPRDRSPRGHYGSHRSWPARHRAPRASTGLAGPPSLQNERAIARPAARRGAVRCHHLAVLTVVRVDDAGHRLACRQGAGHPQRVIEASSALSSALAPSSSRMVDAAWRAVWRICRRPTVSDQSMWRVYSSNVTRTSLAGLRGVGYARLSSSTGMVRTPAVWRAYSAKPG